MQSSSHSIPLRDLAESLFMGVNLVRVPKDRAAATVPVIHVKDVAEGVLPDVDELDGIALPGVSQYERQRLLPDDLLVSARGTLMKCAIVPPSHAGAVASSNFIVVRLGKAAPLPAELLYAFLCQPAVQARFLNRAGGTAQAALTIRDLETLSVPLPPQDMQPALARLFTVAEEQYRVAVECARLRREEALDILARHMDPDHAS